MTQYIRRGQLSIAPELDQFIEQQAIVNTGVSFDNFWTEFEGLLAQFMPRNQSLLAKREALQADIDAFHLAHPNATFTEYKDFLTRIGYLVEPPEETRVETAQVDPEIATIAGPQLVVPINNARYALNAVNARWGSLYDALYGTDVIDEEEGAQKTSGYNPKRGLKVIAKARQYLDTIAPLSRDSHTNVTRYDISSGQLTVSLQDGSTTTLETPSKFVAYQGELTQPTSIVLKNNGLHIELQFADDHPIADSDPAKIKDIVIESALTTIMDCEDSVAAVDAEDKTLVYQNWLGLMQGSLSIEMQKNGKSVTRKMAGDRIYTTLDSEELKLSGRSLMFVRNVGHLMTTDAILFNDQPIPEGIMDGVITSLIGMHDLQGNSPFANSKANNIYIVKPKMHGPEEVTLTNDLFNAIEDMLGLPRYTVKMGIMDEERRTSVNLAACIAAARFRTVFINTGFLDRTGDEIHTSMKAGAFAPKGELKGRPWIAAYEKANVCTGLACEMSGKAQIGKGMWPIPDQMANMMQAKIGHPQAGANTAWVPSPTAASLHALHYHQVDVFALQESMQNEQFDGIDTILDIPLMEPGRELSDAEIQRELDNNIQGILGYVVRWVHQGVGCSKVPDINNVGLMEDRATLRISAQHIANWLTHGLVSLEQIDATLARMAQLVDAQNVSDVEYIPMCPDLDNSIGYQAARDLIVLGSVQPSGYTEPLLHARRREMKAYLASQ